MTGTKVEIGFISALSNLVPNTVLETIMHKNFTQLGVPVHDEQEIEFAGHIRATLAEEDKAEDIRFDRELEGKALSDKLMPYRESAVILPGSTDVGDVSWVVPTAQCMTACEALGTPFHSWQMVAQGTTSIAHKGMLHAGKVMAATAWEVMQNPQVISEAKAELKERLNGEVYRCPIPPEVTHYQVVKKN